FVKHVPGGELLRVAAAIVLPDAFIEAVVEVKILKVLELRARRREEFFAELDVAVHRAADIEENQHIDLVAALRAHDQVEIALMRGRLDRAVEIELCRCALARETAEPPQRDLDVAGTEFDLIVEV